MAWQVSVRNLVIPSHTYGVKKYFRIAAIFVFEIRMKYDETSPHGAGVLLLDRLDLSPVGDNPPLGPNDYYNANGIWADLDGFNVKWGDQVIPITSNPNNFHTYTLEYANGSYSTYVDGLLMGEPTANSNNTRPNTMWIGNPVVTHWGVNDWSDFTIDYVHTGANKSSVAAVRSDTVSLSPPLFCGTTIFTQLDLVIIFEIMICLFVNSLISSFNV